MTQVLFATDLSEAAGVAERLIANIPWPGDSSFRIVTVVPWMQDLVASPWLVGAPLDAEEIERSRCARAEAQVGEVVARFAARGLSASWVVMRGQPADAIVDIARSEACDLIVLGSRGLGALEGALLGSVSEAVADRAPCPVLIARSDQVYRSIVADDASTGADLALEYVRQRPHLLGVVTRLVAVHTLDDIWAETIDLPMDPHSVQVIADGERALWREVRDDLEGAAERLRLAGQNADSEIVEGRPGPAIVDAALSWHADLVVVGSRRRTGLTRLVLGSVGRHVLHHSHCSVLLVGRVRESERSISNAGELVGAAQGLRSPHAGTHAAAARTA
jgi:nucleotide-binding universal stress UspA family protein